MEMEEGVQPRADKQPDQHKAWHKGKKKLLLTAVLAIAVLASLAAVSIAFSALRNNKKVIDIQASTEKFTNRENSNRTSSEGSDEHGKSIKTSVRTHGSTHDWESLLDLTPTSTESADVTNCAEDEVEFGGSCQGLATRGPCKEGEWLVLLGYSGGSPEVGCQERRCGEGVWWGESCTCITPDQPNPCGEGGEVLVSPYGEGLCGCQEGWEVGVAHGRPGGDQGPCRRAQGAATSGPSDLRLKIFENIPANERQFSRATRVTCQVDEANNCRRVYARAPATRFALEWLETFDGPEDTCGGQEVEQEGLGK